MVIIKRFLGLSIMLAIFISALSLPHQAFAKNLDVDYKYIPIKSGAIHLSNDDFLPLRESFSALGMDVVWKADQQNKIKLTGKNKESYELILDKNGTSIKIANQQSFPCRIQKGVSYIPLSLLNAVLNREIGLSGKQMLVLMDTEPNWQVINGSLENQKPLWQNMNIYQKPEPQKPTVQTTTNPDATAPTPTVANPQNAASKTEVISNHSEHLIWPTSATYISSPYGPRVYPLGDGVEEDFHTGVDIAGNMNDPIYAARAGKVVRASVFSTYGNCVDIDHGNGLLTRYAHLNDIYVHVGDTVAQGAIIGTEGMTGAATGPHLHFETRVNGQAVDPDQFIHYR